MDMRPASRRYRQEAIKPVSAAEALAALRADAKTRGLDKLTKRQINAFILEARLDATTTKRDGIRSAK
jgi:hypothetical protein